MQEVAALDNDECDTMVKAYFRNITRVISESLILRKQSVESSQKMLSIANLEELERMTLSKGIVICMGGHFLNHEILTTLPIHSDKLAYCCIYRNNGRNRAKRFREMYGVPCIPANSRSLIKQLVVLKESALKENKALLVGVLNDIAPTQNSKVKTLKFNNREYNVLSGFEHIGRRMDAGFAHIRMKPIGNDRYSVSFIPLDNCLDKKQSTTERYFQLLMEDISNQPQNWLLWGANSVFFTNTK